MEFRRSFRRRAAAFWCAWRAPRSPSASRGMRRWRTPSDPQDVFEPTIWYSIDRDGIVTVNIIRAEMGQHVGTALARILADELEADWDKVRLDAVNTDSKWGPMVTGGSWSVWQTFPVFSRAGAAGRIALIEVGAKLLGVPTQQCSARNSAVVAADQRSISYAEIVRRGDLRRTFTRDELAKMPIKPASERHLIGRKVDALDIPAEDERDGALRDRRFRRRHGLCAAEDSADPQWRERPFDRRFSRPERQGLHQMSRPRGPVRHGSRLGDGVRRLLSGRHPRRRPGEGRLGPGRRRKCLGAGCPRSWGKADR